MWRVGSSSEVCCGLRFTFPFTNSTSHFMVHHIPKLRFVHSTSISFRSHCKQFSSRLYPNITICSNKMAEPVSQKRNATDTAIPTSTSTTRPKYVSKSLCRIIWLTKGFRINFQDEITVTVGKKQLVDFNVHKDVLCEQSSLFRAATKPEWSGEGRRVVKLPDEKPKMFSTYLQWIYTGQVVDHGEPESEEEVLSCLLPLYILADKLGTPKLKNDCIDLIRELLVRKNAIFGSADTEIAFDNTPTTSSLRKLVVDTWVYTRPRDDLLETAYLEECPHEFVCAVMQGLYYAAKRNAFSLDRHQIPEEKKAKCYYHEHDEFAPPCEG